jgi:hypothetical protein
MDAGILAPTGLLPHIKAGKVKALAIAGASSFPRYRAGSLPDQKVAEQLSKTRERF